MVESASTTEECEIPFDVHRDDRILGILENTLHRTLGGGGEGLIDLFDAGILVELYRQVDDKSR